MGSMRLVQFALLAAIAYIGFEHSGAVIDLYHAAYPDDPLKREALDQCSGAIKNFSRLNEADRENCYTIFSNRVAAIADNPSHLPVNDVRRQEAFDGYQAAQGAAFVSMVPPPSRAPAK
jgi:hypothetical protein